MCYKMDMKYAFISKKHTFIVKANFGHWFLNMVAMHTKSFYCVMHIQATYDASVSEFFVYRETSLIWKHNTL